MERKLLDALNSPNLPSPHHSCAGTGGVTQVVAAALGSCPVPCLSPWEGHTAAASSAGSAAGCQSCISRRQFSLCFTSLYEAAHPSFLMHWKQKRTLSFLLLLSLVFAFRGTKLHTFQFINYMWSNVFLLHWETLFIQDVHGLFKVKV